MSAKSRIRWEDLPLFADDGTIGIAVLGPGRAAEWGPYATALERVGMPSIDSTHGGRYTPAVKAFYDNLYGLRADKPKKPGGVERPDLWKNRKPIASTRS